MSIALAIWGAHIKGIGNALRMETKMQTSWAIAIVFDLIVGIWSFNLLRSNILLWQAAGINVLDMRLWSLCIVAWFGLSILATLTLLQKNFSTDEPIFLLAFPIPPATFFRIFYVIVLVEGSGNWMIGTGLVVGIALASVIGWYALIWVLLLLVGSAIFIWFSMFFTLFTLRYVWPYLKIVLTGGTITVIVVVFLFVFMHWDLVPTLAQISSQHFFSQTIPLELYAALFSLALLSLQLGIFSRWAGNLYISVFQAAQNQFATRNNKTSLWIDFVEFVSGRHRTILGGLIFKGILNQSRSFLTWLRIIVIGVFLALFSPIQTALAPFHIAHPVLAIGYASTIGFLLMLEVGLNAIGGEGDRFTLYLIMPIQLKDVLIAKLIVFLTPALLFSLATSLVLSAVLALTVVQTLLVTFSAIFLVCTSVTFLVLGSAWDEDLDLSIEGFMQAILYEELPASPRRLMLFNAALVFHAALLLLVAFLPLWLSPIILAFISGFVLFTLLSSSSSYITKLQDKG